MSKRLIRRKVDHVLGSSLLNRLYAARGVRDVSELDLSLQHLLQPRLKSLDKAADLIATSIIRQERILIVGDFDADGATSTAMMVDALRSMGGTGVEYLVPDRFEYGYGLTPEIVEVAARRRPDLLVTVDNGMSSIEGVALARAKDIHVVITDHHLPGSQVPDADAIVNPNQLGCEFPGKSLAGVGVAFYVLSAVRAVLKDRNWFAEKMIAVPNLADSLDLVALGTVADVVNLDRNNRILVESGLRRIRSGRARPGILALARVSGVNLTRITSRDLAFGLAPRLNAAGRLDDMSRGIECLLAGDTEIANRLAAELDQLNRERRAIEDEMREQALAHIETGMHLVGDEPPVGICLFHEDWHQGVVGIVASRIKERLHRPVIAFARAGDSELKGSARSVDGLHIRDALDAIAAKYPGMLTKFGGHAMAAGLALQPHRLEAFMAAFDEEARRWLSAEDLERTLMTDGEPGEEIDLALAREIVTAGPWGQGFPEPVFDSEFEILDQRIVAGRHLKMKLRPVDSVRTFEAIAFNQDRLLENRQSRMAWRVDINEYRGLESVQLIVEAIDVRN